MKLLLALALLMPGNNPWAVNDWAPLKAEYERCFYAEPTQLHRYVCASKAHYLATHPTYRA